MRELEEIMELVAHHPNNEDLVRTTEEDLHRMEREGMISRESRAHLWQILHGETI